MPVWISQQGTIDTCFLASINHDMQQHVIPFNMAYLFVATLSRFHRDAPAALHLYIPVYAQADTSTALTFLILTKSFVLLESITNKLVKLSLWSKFHLRKLIDSQLFKKNLHSMQPEITLLCSEVPAMFSAMSALQSCLYPLILFLYDQFRCCFTIQASVFLAFSLFLSSHHKPAEFLFSVIYSLFIK
jgi:hypothetical protein